MATPFTAIYDRFFGKITDDMYLEWTKEDTERDVEHILLDSIPGFEFPRFPLYDYSKVEDISDDDNDESKKTIMQYNCDLTSEEINILALLMYNTWLQRQVASIENTRMKYSGSKSGLLFQK